MPNDKIKAMWISPECDFENLRSNGQYKNMVRLAEENANLLISLYRRHENDKLEKSVRYGMVMLSYFERSLQRETEEDALFWAGKLMGYLEILDKLQFASDQDQMAIERAKLFGTKHLNEIILALETYGAMSQTELGERLNLQASTLSEVLKKVRKTQLIQASPYGKYKVYSLTETGDRYSAALRRKNKRIPEFETAMETMLEYLEDPSVKETCLRLMKDKLSREIGIIVSEGDRISFLNRKCKSFTKFDVDFILQETTNCKEAPLPVLVGTQIESNYDTPYMRLTSDEALFQNVEVSVS